MSTYKTTLSSTTFGRVPTHQYKTRRCAFEKPVFGQFNWSASKFVGKQDAMFNRIEIKKKEFGGMASLLSQS